VKFFAASMHALPLICSLTSLSEAFKASLEYVIELSGSSTGGRAYKYVDFIVSLAQQDETNESVYLLTPVRGVPRSHCVRHVVFLASTNIG
jgi:hypothetical protein